MVLPMIMGALGSMGGAAMGGLGALGGGLASMGGAAMGGLSSLGGMFGKGISSIQGLFGSPGINKAISGVQNIEAQTKAITDPIKGIAGSIGDVGESIIGAKRQLTGADAKDAAAVEAAQTAQGPQSFEQGQGPIEGFDLANYQPQAFEFGGTPNLGKPAGIFDLRTGDVTGTMNERGPETIVPSYDGHGSSSLINQTPGAAAGSEKLTTTVQYPDTGQTYETLGEAFTQTGGPGRKAPFIGGLFGADKEGPSPSNIGDTLRDLASEGGAIAPFNQFKSVMSRSSEDSNQVKLQPGEEAGKIPGTTRTEVTEKQPTGFLGLGKDLGGTLRGLLRTVGFYYDEKRSRVGLPASGVTNWLDWEEKRGDIAATRLTTKQKAAADKAGKGLDTKVETVGNRKHLINLQTGEKIKDLGPAPKSEADKKAARGKEPDLDEIREDAFVQYKKDVKEGKVEEDTQAAQDQYILDYTKLRAEGKTPEELTTTTKKGKFLGIFGKGEETSKTRTGRYKTLDPAEREKAAASDKEYLAWLGKQPRGKYANKAEARQAYAAQRG